MMPHSRRLSASSPQRGFSGVHCEGSIVGHGGVHSGFTPVALSWLKSSVGWLPGDEAVSGALGLILGITGINLTGALMASGGAFRESVAGIISRIFGRR